MKNQVYRLHDGNRTGLEFTLCETNELEPLRDVLEVAIDIIEDAEYKISYSLNLDDIDSLIKYLQESRECIKKFNDNSKPILE